MTGRLTARGALIFKRKFKIETESETHSRWNRRKILKLEKEILTLESFINDTNCCATINGDFTHYEISSDQSTVSILIYAFIYALYTMLLYHANYNLNSQVIIGRGKESDCDLSNEINASRIHRRQGRFSLFTV